MNAKDFFKMMEIDRTGQDDHMYFDYWAIEERLARSNGNLYCDVLTKEERTCQLCNSVDNNVDGRINWIHDSPCKNPQCNDVRKELRIYPQLYQTAPRRTGGKDAKKSLADCRNAIRKAVSGLASGMYKFRTATTLRELPIELRFDAALIAVLIKQGVEYGREQKAK